MSKLRRLLTGERRRRPRYDPEKVRVTNELADLELRLARRLHTTPERLRDYHRADEILWRARGR